MQRQTKTGLTSDDLEPSVSNSFPWHVIYIHWKFATKWISDKKGNIWIATELSRGSIDNEISLFAI